MARRLFMGIEASGCWQTRLGGVQTVLRRDGLWRLRWTEPGRFHISLQDAGYVEEADIQGIVLAMDRAAAACMPFVLYVDALDVFRQRDCRDVLWAGVKGDVKGLENLRETLNSEISRLGYLREPREFTPHITLARVRDDLGQPVISHVRSLADTDLQIEDPHTVDRFSLLHIIPWSGGVRYERVAAATMAIH